MSRSASVAGPIDYMLKRWNRFTRFIDDGSICLTNNAAERALRGFALGRKSWLFAGSDRGPNALPDRTARQLPDQSTTLWVESSSTSDPRLRGALPRRDIA
jgi:hypothetical protein